MDGLEIVGPRARFDSLASELRQHVVPAFKAGTTIVERQSLSVAPFFVLILIQR